LHPGSQFFHILLGLFCCCSCFQQFALVAAALGRVEDGEAGKDKPAFDVALLCGVDEHRQALVIPGYQVEGDFIEEALQAQQWREVSFVKYAPGDVQQIG
jgi:hypothetical protein